MSETPHDDNREFQNYDFNNSDIDAENVNIGGRQDIHKNTFSDKSRYIEAVTYIETLILQNHPEEQQYIPTLKMFEAVINDKIRDFVGRGFVMDAIDSFTEDPNYNSGYFFIEGDPGQGKSAIMAKYIIDNPDTVFHFNIRSQSINTVKLFIQGIKSQLVARYDISPDELPTNMNDYGAYFLELLNSASNKIEPGDKLILAIDALDEVNVDPKHHPANTNILCLPSNLPDNVYVVATKRHGNTILDNGKEYKFRLTIDEDVDVLDLAEQYHEEQIDDIADYIVSKINNDSRLNIDGIEIETGRDIDEFVSLLIENSENNFMYIRHLINDIAKRTYDLTRIFDVIPKGLTGYYQDHWDRMQGDTKEQQELFKTKVAVVYALAVSAAPESVALISKFNNLDTSTVSEIIKQWEQFLTSTFEPKDQSNRWSIYHKSFQDFLFKDETVRNYGAQNPEQLKKDIIRRRMGNFGARFGYAGFGSGGQQNEEDPNNEDLEG